MVELNRRCLLVFLSCILFSGNIFAVDPDLDWKTIESKHLYVHYADGYKAFAERALTIAELAHQRLTKEFDWQPIEKTHIVLSDETDQPNGSAGPVFFNHTTLFLAPPTRVNTLEDFDDWMTTLIIHEYTHIVHLDKSAGAPEHLRSIFGRFFLLFPNLFQPNWVIEGLATNVETDFDRGVGRGQSAMFATMMREEVANGVQPISHVNLPVATWPAGTTRYLYGVYFMRFISERYGEEKLQEWVEEYSNNLFPFFINTNAQSTLGKNLTPLWKEYKAWLEEKFEPAIDAIKAKGIKAGKQISKDAYRSNSVRAVVKDKGVEVYYVRNGGYKRASLMHIDQKGIVTERVDLNNGATLDVHEEAGLLLTQDEFCNDYTIYSDIYFYDKDKNKLKRLTECGRYLYVSWHPDGKQIVAVQNDAGTFKLQLLDLQAKPVKTLWQARDGEIIGQIDVSPNGKNIAASIWRRTDGWNIETFDLIEKRWNKITRGVEIAVNPQYSPDGSLLFSMESSDVYNLYRYYETTGNVEKLTNLIGGAFQSSQALSGDSIYYSGYSAEGFAIYELPAETPSKNLLSKKDHKFSDSHLQRREYSVSSHKPLDYSALSSIAPRWWFPSFAFSDQRTELGVITGGADALGIHNYFLSASYDTKLEKPAARISYRYAERYYLSAAHINELFLEENGKLNRISSRNVISAMWAHHDRRIQHQNDILFGVIYDNTSDDELVDGAIPVDDFEDHLIGAAWLYNSSDFNPLSISLNDGMRLRLVAEDSDLLNSDNAGQVYTLDWRQYIRTGRESVFAVRFLQGWGTDQPRSFKLGGEGANDDVLDVLINGISGEGVFDRRSYALRGYKEGLPQLRGRRAQLLSGEWRFPLQRNETGVMAPPIGLMQWFGAVFVETGSAYEDSPDTYYTSAGVEVTADINLFYNLLLRTRLGYAHGFDDDIGDDRVYLNIGNSF